MRFGSLLRLPPIRHTAHTHTHTVTPHIRCWIQFDGHAGQPINTINTQTSHTPWWTQPNRITRSTSTQCACSTTVNSQHDDHLSTYTNRVSYTYAHIGTKRIHRLVRWTTTTTNDKSACEWWPPSSPHTKRMIRSLLEISRRRMGEYGKIVFNEAQIICEDYMVK